MKRCIVQTRAFAKIIDELIRKRKLLYEDFEAFKKQLIENPEEGNLMPGTGGVRKTRLRSATKGKSGGFRVCYFDDPKSEQLFLILVYQKNEQETLNANEKQTLKKLTDAIKRK
jgi:hypothetical protein